MSEKGPDHTRNQEETQPQEKREVKKETFQQPDLEKINLEIKKQLPYYIFGKVLQRLYKFDDTFKQAIANIDDMNKESFTSIITSKDLINENFGNIWKLARRLYPELGSANENLAFADRILGNSLDIEDWIKNYTAESNYINTQIGNKEDRRKLSKEDLSNHEESQGLGDTSDRRALSKQEPRPRKGLEQIINKTVDELVNYILNGESGEITDDIPFIKEFMQRLQFVISNESRKLNANGAEYNQRREEELNKQLILDIEESEKE